ncbi:MAG: hypothetical protein IT249_17505 [Chitinophagaceae bacterium]|nr:hypothetical protein [Chitinophagaceae bacterium]
MKHSKTTIILTILISIALFVLGLFTFDRLFEIILPKVDGGFYQVTELGGQFKTTLLFSFVLGLTPFLILLTWRLAPIISRSKKLASVLTVIVCMTGAIIVRQQILKSCFTGLTKNFTSTVDKMNVSYPVDQINFEYYLFGELIVGCPISYFLLRQKKI